MATINRNPLEQEAEYRQQEAEALVEAQRDREMFEREDQVNGDESLGRDKGVEESDIGVNARCGLAECDCGYTIGGLLRRLELIAEQAKLTIKQTRDASHTLCPYIPEPCGCQGLSECCGAPPIGPEAGPWVPPTKDSPVGVCGQYHEHVGFEMSDENTWKFLGTTLYGDDADGNRGVPLRAWVCTVCGNEIEVIG